MQGHGIGGRGLQTLCAVLMVLLSACAPRPGGETLTVVPEAEAAQSLAITVASTAPICGICSMPRIPTG